jgi:hypothetical protein
MFYVYAVSCRKFIGKFLWRKWGLRRCYDPSTPDM